MPIFETTAQEVRLRDAYFSIGEKIPENIVADLSTMHGKFIFSVLSKFTDKDFDSLNREAAKKADVNRLFLDFFEVHNSSGNCGKEIRDFEHFDLSKVIDIKINGNTEPYLHRAADIFPYHYLSITLVVE